MEEEKQEDIWAPLAALGTPEQWFQIYEDYQEMLTREDAASFWREQFQICNEEREKLKS